MNKFLNIILNVKLDNSCSNFIYKNCRW